MKRKGILWLIAYAMVACFCSMTQVVAQESIDNTIRDGGEYHLYNVYYGRVLGGNAENNSPVLSVYGTNTDADSYVFVAEASTLHSGYYWLRQKSSGKYLQASNAQGDTWSVWFAGSLNKAYNSYEWGLTGGTAGEIISNRGEQINTTGNVWLAPDAGKESQTYVNVYYDKPKMDRSVWQIVDARYPLDDARLKLYTDALDEVIAQGELVYDNPAFGTTDDKAELAAALYNARSARNEAAIDNVATLETAREALTAAVKNIQENNYDIWVSGSSFATGEAFTIAMNGLQTTDDGAEVLMLVRNSQKTGALISLSDKGGKIGETTFTIEDGTDNQTHDFHFAFDGTNVSVYVDGVLKTTAPQTSVATMTSVGQGAEWTMMGTNALVTYRPEIVSTTKALAPGEIEKNSHDKAELHVLKLVGQNITLDEPIDYHVNASQAMTDSKIDLCSEDAWVVFDNVRPSDVIANYLKDITINGVKSLNGFNCRVVIYLHGTGVIPHPATYQPFYGYGGQMYSGDEYVFGVGNNEVGDATNEIQSFILKRGYMVTLATNSDGSGYSRVYVADHEDKRIEVLPDLLRQRVSYINVRKWHYVSKKGWCTTESTSATNTVAKLLGTTWFYTWSADRSTQVDMEYVPQKQHLYWPSWEQINGHEKSTAVLGLNEPDHSEQHESADCSCGGTIDPWKATTTMPDYQACGLRIGSPSPTDASWLTKFIGHCNDMAYRCDFVAFHAYWGTNEAPNAESWRSQLKSIYDNTKRPIWLTEWNNGASWTTESWPSSYGDKLSKQREALIKILKVFDERDFIERYSIYNWDSYYRAVISWASEKNNCGVTPAGEVYRDNHPTHAYQEKMQFVPRGWFPSMKTDNQFNFVLRSFGRRFIPTVTNKNGDFTAEEIYEYLREDGTYATFYARTKRGILDATTTRSDTISCDDCPIELFANDSLTLRMKITTLAGGVTYSDPVRAKIPEYLRNYYTSITSAKKDGLRVNVVDGGLTAQSEKPQNMMIYNVNGVLVRDVMVKGEVHIVLPSGIYIVNGRKLVIR